MQQDMPEPESSFPEKDLDTRLDMRQHPVSYEERLRELGQFNLDKLSTP